MPRSPRLIRSCCSLAVTYVESLALYLLEGCLERLTTNGALLRHHPHLAIESFSFNGRTSVARSPSQIAASYGKPTFRADQTT